MSRVNSPAIILWTGAFACASCFPVLLAAGLLCAGIASAQQCAKPADVSAFDIASLKSKLMVTALTCNQQDRYNEFVQRFRSDLMAHERALHAYFARVVRRRARATGARRLHHQPGEHPVAERHPAGHVVLPAECRHLHRGAVTGKGADLAGYAASKALPQPIEVVACPVPTPHRPGQRTTRR